MRPPRAAALLAGPSLDRRALRIKLRAKRAALRNRRLCQRLRRKPSKVDKSLLERENAQCDFKLRLDCAAQKLSSPAQSTATDLPRREVCRNIVRVEAWSREGAYVIDRLA